MNITINKNIKFVMDMFDDLIDNHFKCNRKELVDNGAIFYFNDHNGTKFDWFVNNHISTLAAIYPDGTEAVKILIFKDGSVQAYYYKKGSQQPDETVETQINETTTKLIATLLFTISDRIGIFSKRLNELDISHELTDDDIKKFDDENYISDNIQI